MNHVALIEQTQKNFLKFPHEKFNRVIYDTTNSRGLHTIVIIASGKADITEAFSLLGYKVIKIQLNCHVWPNEEIYRIKHFNLNAGAN